MIHYKCKECDKFTGILCSVYENSENLDLYKALKGVDCKVLDNNNVLYEVGIEVKYDDKEDYLNMHFVKNNRKDLENDINLMKNEIKKVYGNYKDFEIGDIFVDPILHEGGYYIEFKKIEY